MDSKQEKLLKAKNAELEKQLAAKNRDLEIEAALERVRARTMAMQRSEELSETAYVLYQQFTSLGEKPIQITIGIISPEDKTIEFWGTDLSGNKTGMTAKGDVNEPFLLSKLFAAWEKKQKSAMFALSGKELEGWVKYRQQITGLVSPADQMQGTRYVYLGYFSKGAISISTGELLPDETVQILERFATVFDGTYTRFLDLQKAEAQVREAQIEAALEKVRSRSLAMHNTGELQEVVNLVFEKLQEIGMAMDSVNISIPDEKTRSQMIWIAVNGIPYPRPVLIPDNDDPISSSGWEAWFSRVDYFSRKYSFEEKNQFYNWAFEHSSLKYMPPERKAWVMQSDGCAYSIAFGKVSAIWAVSYSGLLLNPKEAETLKRFGRVFEQAYIRFLDLQKVEAQARESQIQLALERVRARTMAMQRSEELAETATVLFQQLLNLGISSERTFIGIPTADTRKIELWGTEQGGHQMSARFEYEADATYAFSEIYKAWQEKRSELTVILKGKNLEEHVNYVRNVLHMPLLVELVQKQRILYNAFFSKSLLMIVTPDTQSKETLDILKRFAGVFDGTYTRFLDLQKAEDQAREAQIETALEKVRGKAMAMHDSNDLSSAVSLVFTELKKLGIKPIRCGVGLFMKDPPRTLLYTATISNDSDTLDLVGWVDVVGHPVLEKIFNSWLNQEDYFPVLNGKELKTYCKKLSHGLHIPSIPDGRSDEKQYGHFLPFPEGMLNAWAERPYSAPELKILDRFKNIISLTFRRYLDLKKAEEQAREAQIEAALERVRSKTMAMHNSNDVGETVTLMFNELIKLGVDKIARCGIAIPDNNGLIELWTAKLSKDEKEEMIIGHINTSIHPMLRLLYDAWKSKQPNFEYVLEGDDLDSYITALNNYPGYPIKYDKGAWGAKQYHNDFFFHEGMVFAFTFQPLSAGIAAVFKRFSGVFGQTYRRFLDLQKAEAQALEARIETSLERVRSRTMAMQKSEELAEVIQLVYDQLCQLNFNIDNANFVVNYKESDDLDLWLAVNGQRYSTKMHIPYLDHSIFNHLNEAKEKGLSFLSDSLTFEEKNTFFRHFFENTPQVPQERKKAVFESPGYARSVVFMKTIALSIQNYAAIPYSDAENEVLVRFGKVFEQTYTRFNDLKQAEEQAREAKIEAGLERVRAKAMAMHSSENLAETIGVFYYELGLLSVTPRRCGLGLMEKGARYADISTMNTTEQGESIEVIGRLKMAGHRVLDGIYDNWLLQKEYHPVLRGNEIREYYQLVRPQISYPDYPNSVVQYGYFFYFRDGGAFAWTDTELPEDELQIYRRFTSVLSLTYRRYKDIKEAEAQAKESQIQLALERVRARTMAMQKSDELAETAMTLFKQFNGLDVKPERIFIGIIDEDAHIIDFWGTEQGGDQMSPRFEVNADATVGFSQIYKAWGAKKKMHTVIMKGKELADHINYVQGILHMPIKQELVQEQRIMYSAFFSKGLLMIVTPDTQSKETLDILERFAGVFNLTYTRFNDLKIAEEQAREATIEAALERVRSKTMAMHNSQDVGDTVGVMFHEFVKLGIEKMIRCGIGIMSHENRTMELWTAKWGENEKVNLLIGHLDMTIHKMLGSIYDAWKSKQSNFAYQLAGSDLVTYAKVINSYPDYPLKYDLNSLPPAQFFNDFFFNEGVVFAFTSNPLSDEIVTVLKRFAGVFGQTYRRYLDLQKAEAAAREAQIEAALERVRSKAMAMRSSGDVNATANTVFIELRKLDVDLVRCGLGLMEKESHISTIHAATNSAEGGSLEVLGNIDMNIHPVLEGIYNQWRQNKDYFPVLEEESLRTYYEALHESGISVPEWKSGEKQYGYFLQFAYGSLYAWSGKQESEITIKTLKRFTSVIGLTYTRYIELQKAESNTKEAIKQASLDRVRAEIASMRKQSDLERITPLIWDELTILGIPFIRCGVFIMDEEQKLIHTFLSTPDGKAIGAFHVPFDTSGNFEKMVDSWRHNKPYIDHWKEEAFSQFAETLVKQGAISSKAQYMRTLPHEGVHLNFLPFLQGMLYVGNVEPLAEDNIDLIQAVADAFSTAYARYEDFNKLEAAKQQVDNTLTDLKAAQTKLIQSEKMASLGELTAGIAHEIQNPLNFVNNFSEVNQEMIDELEQELKAGNIEEALAIAADIKQNEEKISHHGKRADGIVKGMLQHSRTGGGEKQLTNMNTLADEFLRLSYHGLRAKDKTFNAEMVTHFDPNLPKISVIAQDMGRVMLNLFNNAFYAVNQRKKTASPDYRPEVSVTTSSENGQVTIKVKDNGTGIPDAVKEKIMQPFFTTKPTGEGTGLGLSLTYDMVVKGHGGKIDVNTKEDEYTEFIISLPLN